MEFGCKVEASSQGLRLCKDVPSPNCAAWLSSVEYLEGVKGVRRRTPFLIAPKREEILERLLFL
jgi:hypothetical protein